jgi:hypothetical protein
VPNLQKQMRYRARNACVRSQTNSIKTSV